MNRSKSERRIVVAAFGTFMVLHPGHLRYLEFAKKHGNALVVVVSRDENVISRKGSCPVPETQRAEMVGALKIVDKVVLGNVGKEKMAMIEKIRPDVMVLGPDDETDEEDLKTRFPRIKVVRMKERDERGNGLKKSRSIIEKLSPGTMKEK